MYFLFHIMPTGAFEMLNTGPLTCTLRSSGHVCLIWKMQIE